MQHVVTGRHIFQFVFLVSPLNDTSAHILDGCFSVQIFFPALHLKRVLIPQVALGRLIPDPKLPFLTSVDDLSLVDCTTVISGNNEESFIDAQSAANAGNKRAGSQSVGAASAVSCSFKHAASTKMWTLKSCDVVGCKQQMDKNHMLSDSRKLKLSLLPFVRLQHTHTHTIWHYYCYCSAMHRRS